MKIKNEALIKYKKLKTLLAFIIIPILIPLLCILCYIIAWYLEPYFYLPQIQAAINRDCPEKAVQADARGFSSDPALDWGNGEIWCDTYSQDTSWRCVC